MIFKLFGTPTAKAKGHVKLPGTEKIDFLLDGRQIAGYRWNHPQPRKALILHGFASSAANFEDYVTRLTKVGFEVLAFDAPAHGKSEGEQTNALEYCTLIEKVIATFGPVEYFVSHSFGGISLSLALEKTVHSEKTKVVFIAPATETTTAVNNAFSLLQITDSEVRDEFDKLVHRLSNQQTEWFSIRRAMNNIKASVLWIHDEADTVTPWADAEKVKNDRHPNIRFVVTKGLGHSGIYRNNDIKNMVVDFLNSE